MAREGYPNLKDGPKKYPTHVEPYLELIEGYARHGLSDQQIADRLNIDYHTFRHYIKEEPDLLEVLTRGRVDGEVIVENAMFKRAIGYNYVEKTTERRKTGEADEDGKPLYKLVVTKKVTKHVQGDFNAQKYWLEHRAPKRWERDPMPGIDPATVNAAIVNLASLLKTPVPERQIGCEEDD